ncbi:MULTISPECIES: AlbA family DNA-binding domain-containing protein [unclassified Paenibacillus]|uniref:AlbA family DNA-binding domain-containing protein n=1 Tax=unclassified Paenibacillus TaxID=185978 RepID=UPI003630B776
MIEEREITQDEINQLLAKKENHRLDFKSMDISPNKLQNTFVAFANADGGDLYIGIEDNAVKDRLKGFNEPEHANDIIKHLIMETNPTVEGVEIELLKYKKYYFVHFIIPKSEKVHYTASGDCYQRINAASTKIKGDQVTQLGYSKGFYKFEEQRSKLLNSTIFLTLLF